MSEFLYSFISGFIKEIVPSEADSILKNTGVLRVEL